MPKSLIQILRDPEWRVQFMEFCKNEDSYENVLFWLRIDDYKKITNKEIRKIVANKIYHEYIESITRDEIKNNIKKMLDEEVIKRTMFDDAQNEVFQSMEDLFNRFVENFNK